MRARVSRRLSWGLLTAALASMPYTVLNITGPAIPLHFTLTPLCIAAAVSVLTGWLMGNRREARIRLFFVLGWVFTACLVCLEFYACVRGNSYLTSVEAVQLNSILAAAELVAASSALTFWCLSAPSGDSGSRGRCLPCIAVGAVLPFLVYQVADLFSVSALPASCGLCGSRVACVRADCSLSDRPPWPIGLLWRARRHDQLSDTDVFRFGFRAVLRFLQRCAQYARPSHLPAGACIDVYRRAVSLACEGARAMRPCG